MMRELRREMTDRPDFSDAMAMIEARALKLYPFNSLRRARYVAKQAAILRGLK